MTNSQPILQLKNIITVVNPKTNNEATILNQLNFDIYPGDFITIVGANGAGKSTLFNVLAGVIKPNYGQILHHKKDITTTSIAQRTKFLSRVFQDPKIGTAPRMTVAENILLATKRGQKRGLHFRHLQAHRPQIQDLTTHIGNSLAQRLDTPTENLSGGQRQTLSFLMATLNQPELLLLDEHTAALDPHSSQQLLDQTNQIVTQQHLTCLMITHHLEDALKYGNRLIVLNQGQIQADLTATEKKQLTTTALAAILTNSSHMLSKNLSPS